MKLFGVLALSFVLSFAALPAMAANNEIIGTVLEVEGTGSISSGGTIAPLALNMPVRLHDVVSTGPKSRAYILLIDNTELTVAENGQMSVDDYAFDIANPPINHASYSFLKGAFLYVSGLVAKKDAPDVTIKTPVGSIGIRGTRFWGGPMDGQYGFIVGDGTIVLDTGYGKATLTRGLGTTVAAPGAAPGAVMPWPPQRIDRAIATVSLRDAVTVGARMQAHVPLQQALRAQHIQALRARGIDLPQNIIDETNSKNNHSSKNDKGTTLRGNSGSGVAATTVKSVQDTAASSVATGAPTSIISGTSAAAATTVQSVTTTTNQVVDQIGSTVKSTTEKTIETVEKPVSAVSDTVQKTVETTVSKTTQTLAPATSAVTDTTGKITNKLLNK